MSEFEFDFRGARRDELLSEADKSVRALASDLGETTGEEPDTGVTGRLLEMLNGDVAQFSAYPEIVKLEKSHFETRGLRVPAQFDELTKRYSFYWLRFPITLAAPPQLPYRKLECAIELNPDEARPHLRPRAHSILPDRKFQDAMKIETGLEIHIGENFEFEAGLPKVTAPTPVGQASVAASVDAKAAAKMGVVAGPFEYRFRKAKLTHSPAGTEKVLWRLDGEELVSQDDPIFIIVMQLPREVDKVSIAAALQAYHGFSLAEAGLGQAIQYFTSRLATFFRAGAPVFDERMWDVTPSL